MSRSYKRYPVTGDTVNKKERKRLANQAVRAKLRNANELPQRNSYRKLYDSWDICDFLFTETWEEYRDFWEELGKETTYYEYYKFYLRK